MPPLSQSITENNDKPSGFASLFKIRHWTAMSLWLQFTLLIVSIWICAPLYAADWNICTHNSSSDTTGTLYDSGGAAGNYGDNENCSFLISPGGSPAQITLSFSAFSTESGWDGLLVYDGTDASGTLLGSFSGFSPPSDVVATSGSIYLSFSSNFFNNYPGFTASWTSTGGGSGFCGSGNLVMVTTDGTYNYGYDSQKRALFESWGFTVTAMADDAPQTDFDNAAAANDVMFISESIDPSTMGTKARDLDIGIVLEDIYLADEMAFVESPGNPIPGSHYQIYVLDNSHYITDGFSTGLLTVYTAIDYIWGNSITWASGGQWLARTPGVSPTLYAFETGDALVGGVTATNRRVSAHFFHQTNPAIWNDDLKTILQRSLEWATCSSGSNPPPNIDLTRGVAVISDPFNNTTNPKIIPGAVLDYTVTVTNQGLGPTDSDTVIITNPVGDQNMLYVGDLAGAGSGPVSFSDGSTASGLTCTFSSLDSDTDSISFSNDNGSTYTHTPTPDADGYDAAVTHMRVSPAGTFAASDGSNHPGFSFVFRVKVK
jgi:hypothetical protein